MGPWCDGPQALGEDSPFPMAWARSGRGARYMGCLRPEWRQQVLRFEE